MRFGWINRCETKIYGHFLTLSETIYCEDSLDKIERESFVGTLSYWPEVEEKCE